MATSKQLPEQPPLAEETLFQELMDLFAEAAEGGVARAFDKGTIDRAELQDRVSNRYREASKWLHTAYWFADAYGNDLSHDEYDVTVDGPAFKAEQFYRSNFVEMLLHYTRPDVVDTRHEWRDLEDGDERAYIVAEREED